MARMILRLLDHGAPTVALIGSVAEKLTPWLAAACSRAAFRTARRRARRSHPDGAASRLGMAELSDACSRQSQSLMLRETREAPAAVARLLAANADVCRELGARLRKRPPAFAVSSARGSSDTAATFAKYLLEIRLGIVTASVGPSVSSVYAASPNMKDALFFTVSQSGRSPDILRLAEAARAGGALTVAFVNDAASPLAELCEIVLPLQRLAGAERGGDEIRSSPRSRPSCRSRRIGPTTESCSTRSSGCPMIWRRPPRSIGAPPLPLLDTPKSLFVAARGIGLALAQEAALKLKETCGIHAEALSAAELMHGPHDARRAGFSGAWSSRSTTRRFQSVVDLVAVLGAARRAGDRQPGPAAGGRCIALPTRRCNEPVR